MVVHGQKCRDSTVSEEIRGKTLLWTLSNNYCEWIGFASWINRFPMALDDMLQQTFWNCTHPPRLFVGAPSFSYSSVSTVTILAGKSPSNSLVPNVGGIRMEWDPSPIPCVKRTSSSIEIFPATKKSSSNAADSCQVWLPESIPIELCPSLSHLGMSQMIV